MASRYWVGGAGNWDATTTHWSATSGGAGGASVPTAADDVFFNSASNATAYTVTLLTAPVCLSITVTGPASGNVTFAGSAAWSISGNVSLPATGLTWSNTSAITFGGASQTITTNGVSLTNALTFSGAASTKTLGSALTTSGNVSQTAGTLDLSAYTFTCANFASISGTRTLSFGTGNITCTGSGNATLNLTTTGLTVSGTAPTVNLTYSGAASRLVNSISSINLNVTAGTGTFGVNSSFSVNNLNFTGFAGTLSNSTYIIVGNLTISTGMTLAAGSSTMYFAATATGKTITTNGKTFDFPVIFQGTGGGWTLQDNLIVGVPFGTARTLTLSTGTLNTNGKTVATTGNFVSSGSGVRTLTLGASSFYCYGDWLFSGTNATVNPGTSSIYMNSLAGAGTQTFAGNGLSYYNLILNSSPSIPCVVSGSNTFNDISDFTGNGTLTLTSGTTQTVSNFSLSGSGGGSYTTLNSTSTGARANLSKSSGTVSCDYLFIQDSNATGGATWNAGTHSVNGGNNLGWLFGGSYTASIIETVSASDLSYQSVGYALYSTEGVACSDAFSLSAGFLASQTEGVTVADVLSIGQSYSLLAEEALYAGDDSSFLTNFYPLVVEGVYANDYGLASNYLSLSISESSSVLDTISCAAGFLAPQTEGVALADSETEQANYLISPLESLYIADAMSIVAAYTGSITEAIMSADSIAASRGAYYTIVESLTVAEARSASLSLVYSAVETLAVSDARVTICQYHVSASDAVALSDVLYEHGWAKIPDSQVASWMAVSDSQTPNWVTINDTQTPNWVPVQDEQ